MENKLEKVDNGKAKGDVRARKLGDAIDIPISLMESDAVSALGARRRRVRHPFLRKPGHFRPPDGKALITLAWNYDPQNVVTQVVFTPKGYKVNSQSGDLHNDQNLLDAATVVTTVTQFTQTGTTVTAQYIAGIKSNGKGTYYVSVMAQLYVGNDLSGIDEIFVRFEDEG
jgi:hypothetical protein